VDLSVTPNVRFTNVGATGGSLILNNSGVMFNNVLGSQSATILLSNNKGTSYSVWIDASNGPVQIDAPITFTNQVISTYYQNSAIQWGPIDGGATAAMSFISLTSSATASILFSGNYGSTYSLWMDSTNAPARFDNNVIFGGTVSGINSFVPAYAYVLATGSQINNNNIGGTSITGAMSAAGQGFGTQSIISFDYSPINTSVTVGTNSITFNKAGVYKIQTDLQISFSSTTNDRGYLAEILTWYNINGAAVTFSAAYSQFNKPPGSVSFLSDAATSEPMINNIVYNASVNDVLRIYWQTLSLAINAGEEVIMPTLGSTLADPHGIGPVSSPAVQVTINKIN
jgi:hypothetical protein